MKIPIRKSRRPLSVFPFLCAERERECVRVCICIEEKERKREKGGGGRAWNGVKKREGSLVRSDVCGATEM